MICGKVRAASPTNITLFILLLISYSLIRKTNATTNIDAVTIVKGRLLRMNILMDFERSLSRSCIRVIECRAECKKQKYNVKAKSGCKK